MSDMDRALRISEVADKLDIKPRQVRALIHGGHLAAINVSSGDRPSWRVEQADLAAFCRSRKKQVANREMGRRARRTQHQIDEERGQQFLERELGI